MWPEVSIGELERRGILSAIQDGNHGERHPKTSDYVDSGIPFVMAKDLREGDLDLKGCSFIARELAEKLRIGFAKPGDVLLTHKATMGRVALVPPGYEFIMLTPQVTYYRVGDKEQLSNVYLKYAFLAPGFQHQLQSSEQSTRKYIGITEQRRLLISLPPPRVQRRIAGLLGALDDRIKLLRDSTGTSEAIARAIFKSWFVDLNPVRAKAEGREPEGMDPATAALFPSEFQESELGPIPNGWSVRPLDKVASFLNGLAMQKYPVTGDGGSLPVIKIAQLKQGSAEGADIASDSIPPQYHISDGDLLFSWSGSLDLCLWAGGPGGLNQHLFKVTSDAYPLWFYYFWIQQYLPRFRDIAAHKATTMGHIQRHHLTEALVIAPPEVLFARMTELFSPLVERTLTSKVQQRTLAAVRDTLLPKLISGQIRVPEEAVGAAL